VRYLTSLILAAALFVSGCDTRTETQTTEQKSSVTDTSLKGTEVFTADLVVGGYPVQGTITRKLVADTNSVTKEEGQSKLQSTTKVEIPAEFYEAITALKKIAQGGAVGLVLGNGGGSGSSGGSFLSSLATTATSPEGLTAIGTATAGFGTVGVMYRNRVRRREQELEKQKDDEADEMLRQIVVGLEKFIADPNVSDECKKLLMTELSKSLDKPTKDWLLELGFKVA
jgi:hypothetical protein